MSFTALHIGDLHFWSVPLNPALYFSKRVLGVGNLLYRRAREFRQREAPKLTARIAELRPDALLFSGDFSTTALPAEFRHARAALDPMLNGGNWIAVPGNHDRYTPADIAEKVFERELLGNPGAVFPQCRLVAGDVGVIAIDGGTRNGIRSFGHFKDSDRAPIRAFIEEKRGTIRELWVLCHFPAEDPPGILKPKRQGELHNGDALLALLREAELPALFLHGHHHYRWLFGSPTVPGLTYVNAGAPMLRRRGAAPDLGFWELLRQERQTHLRRHRCDLASGEWSALAAAMPGPGEFADWQR